MVKNSTIPENSDNLSNFTAEIIQFPITMHDELQSNFASENQVFVRDYRQAGDVDVVLSFPAMRDMKRREEESTYDFMAHGTLYGKILDNVKKIVIPKSAPSYTGQVSYETYSYIWKIIFSDENGFAISPEVAMETENVNRKLVFFLPDQSLEQFR